jgi:hypothetical protein
MDRKAIRDAYWRGETIEDIAEAGASSVEETEIYLTAWCSAGCPEDGFVLTESITTANGFATIPKVAFILLRSESR